MAPLPATISVMFLLNVTWDSLIANNLAVPTFQNSVDPYYRMDTLPFTSNISATVFQWERALKAELVRHVPWFPYPQLAVAELAPPSSNTTSWNFELIDPITNAFMDAMEGRPVVMNFATPPTWIFDTPDYSWNPDPNARDVGYEKGQSVKDMQTLVDYYVRLYTYYTKGGMTDEAGKFHKGYNYSFDWFEIFNEVEAEHGTSPADYTARYDAIVTALRAIAPHAKFLGLALGDHNDFAYYEYFLNSSNHAPGIPIDGISYHNYVSSVSTDPAQISQDFFGQADTFFEEVKQIQRIRAQLQPKAITMVNEIGCAYEAGPLNDMYWSLCAGYYAYMYGNLAALGVEVIGESQMIGFVNGTYNTEWPCTSMVNWQTGAPNQRYWVLKMIIDFLDTPGKEKAIVHTEMAGPSASPVYAQSFIKPGPAPNRVTLLVNKSPQAVSVQAVGSTGSTLAWVDATTGENPYKTGLIKRDTIFLNGSATAIIAWGEGQGLVQ